MLKKPASGVLASLRSSTYRSVRLASSLAAALLDSLFEHPVGGVLLVPQTCRPSKICRATKAFPQPAELIFYSRRVDTVWYFAGTSNMNRRLIEMRHYLVVSALLVVGALSNPCGAQTPPPAPPVQDQAVQTPQAEPSAGVSGQANVEPISGLSPGIGPTTSLSAGKRFRSAGQGLPGMLGGPPIKGSMGFQDPSSRYMRPPVIPPLSCDPAVNIPC